MKIRKLSVCLFSLVYLCTLTSQTIAQQKSIAETAIGAGNFNTLVAAAKAADLVGVLSGGQELTVFAPTDEAFAKLPAGTVESLLLPENKSKLAAVLTYHVVPGRVLAADAYGLDSATALNGQKLELDLRDDSPKINNATLTTTDILCTNGVIHVIDEVLLPADKSIPVTATEAGIFNTLLAAVNAADLGGVLSGEGPFTVFAPTDDAFAKLPEGTVDSLLEPGNKQKLVDILKYHVVSGRVYDDQAVKAGSAQTLLGRGVKIGFSAKGISVNDATVVSKNIETSNGVVHAIDAVLIPENNNGNSNSSITPAHAVGMLTTAIHQGVPAFNSGDHHGCCNVYESTMKNLMDMGIDGADAQTTSIISNALSHANRTANDTDRAWALRSGIDSLKVHLTSMAMHR